MVLLYVITFSWNDCPYFPQTAQWPSGSAMNSCSSNLSLNLNCPELMLLTFKTKCIFAYFLNWFLKVRRSHKEDLQRHQKTWRRTLRYSYRHYLTYVVWDLLYVCKPVWMISFVSFSFYFSPVKSWTEDLSGSCCKSSLSGWPVSGTCKFGYENHLACTWPCGKWI